MEYTKGGQIFNAQGNYEWMDTYACPVTTVAFDTFIRVYFTTRSKMDAKGNFQTYITFADCDINDLTHVLYVHDRPLLEFGGPGTFDEHGTMIADVIVHEGKFYMYYMGWQRSEVVPYMNRVGLAMSDDGTNFTKVSAGPVIGISRFLPYGLGNISVLVKDGIFHMWYTHYLPWIKTEIGYRPNYDIRYASSANGMDWNFGGQCLQPSTDNEALATPSVCIIDGKYHMWYAFRPAVDASGKSGAYRIGYAISDDGLKWERRDSEMTLTVSETGWDSDMVCAPDVLQVNNETYLFYCGNHYGRDGFGYAKITL